MKTRSSLTGTGAAQTPPSDRKHPARPCSRWRPLPLLPLLLGLFAVPVAVPAAPYDDFTYTNNGTAITITGYTGPGGDVTIPDTIYGFPVTDIGRFAFVGLTNLSRVTIPDRVATIGTAAFYSCSNLVGVALGNGVTSIGVSAFSYCTRLTRVTIPDSVTTLGSYAFYECASLTGVTLGHGVTGIEDWTFAACASLTNLAIPDSVTGIGGYAFYDCPSLTGVAMGNGVTSIGDRAFWSCTRLTGITIPDGVTNIGGAAFQSCPSLTAITVDARNAFYSSREGVLFNSNQTTLIQYPGGKAGSYPIPDGVTSLESHAFYECTRLTGVTIPGSVTRIGLGAFQSCPSLTTITVDALNLFYRSVDGVLFDKSQSTLIQCPGGKAGSYTIPDGVVGIFYQAFYECANLTHVTIPDGVANIGDGAFVLCTSLDTVTIGNGVTTIGDGAFLFCTNLSSVTVGNSVTCCGASAFAFCPSLAGVYFTGNAPCIVEPGSTFDQADQATVYYLPETTGWGPDYDGRPTQPWLPSVRTGDASFGVQTNQFGFTITWVSGRGLVVEASTNLATATWTPLHTNTLTDGTLYFSDPDWTQYPARFYRLRSP